MLLNIYIITIIFFWLSVLVLAIDTKNIITSIDLQLSSILTAFIKLLIISFIPGINVLLGFYYMFSYQVRERIKNICNGNSDG